MEKRTINMIKKKLRETSTYAPNRNLCIKQAKVVVPTGVYYKNGREKTKVQFLCAYCKELQARDNIQVDHIDEVGPFKDDWDDYIGRLFCSVDNLQVLCKDCHTTKTKEYQKYLRLTRAI